VIGVEWQVWFVGILFVVIYAIIISEKIHRTSIALFGAIILLLLGIAPIYGVLTVSAKLDTYSVLFVNPLDLAKSQN
jgi:Na+/H+ antiporter NhaD/arsenite permease-like protein